MFKQKGGELRESNVNEIVRFLTDSRYLNKLYKEGFDGQMGGHSKRVKHIYKDYINNYSLYK